MRFRTLRSLSMFSQAAISEAWNALQPLLPDEVPRADVSLHRGRRLQCGSAARDLRAGRPPVVVVNEADATSAEAVLGCLLHAAAHLLAAARGWEDTSRDGAYHNERFTEAAMAVGLEPAPIRSGGRGFDTASPTETAVKAAGSVLKRLRAAQTEDAPEIPSGRSRTPVKAQCACPRIIRVSRSVLSQAPIICGACGKPFATSG